MAPPVKKVNIIFSLGPPKEKGKRKEKQEEKGERKTKKEEKKARKRKKKKKTDNKTLQYIPYMRTKKEKRRL